MAYRAQPQGNRICTAVNQQRDATSHKQRVEKIRPTVDTSSPATMSLLINKSKKDQLLEERCSQIDYENRILLKKMSHIMRSNNLDNVQQLKPKSLNAESRKRELKKIMDDNQSILRRIQTRRPYYDRKTWQQHADHHSAYLENIREKPIPASVLRSRSASTIEEIQEIVVDEHGREHVVVRQQVRTSRYLQPLNKRGSATTTTTKKQPKQVTKEGRSIDGQYVIVTVDEMTQPQHALIFRTYDLDTTTQASVVVPFDTLTRLIDDMSLLDVSRREDLANAMLPRLKFKEGVLVLDEGQITTVASPTNNTTSHQHPSTTVSSHHKSSTPPPQYQAAHVSLDEEQKPSEDGYEYADDATTQYETQVEIQGEKTIRFLTSYKGSITSPHTPLIVLYRYTADGYSEMVSRSESANDMGEKEVSISMSNYEIQDKNTSLTFKVFDVSDGADTFHDQSLIGSVTISLAQYMETASATGNVPLEYTLMSVDGQALDAALAIRLNVETVPETVVDETEQQQQHTSAVQDVPAETVTDPYVDTSITESVPSDSTSQPSSEPVAAVAPVDDGAGYGDDFVE